MPLPATATFTPPHTHTHKFPGMKCVQEHRHFSKGMRTLRKTFTEAVPEKVGPTEPFAVQFLSTRCDAALSVVPVKQEQFVGHFGTSIHDLLEHGAPCLAFVPNSAHKRHQSFCQQVTSLQQIFLGKPVHFEGCC